MLSSLHTQNRDTELGPSLHAKVEKPNSSLYKVAKGRTTHKPHHNHFHSHNPPPHAEYLPHLYLPAITSQPRSTKSYSMNTL